jgi:nucleotide-binding universal stress UspA family protein
MGFAFDEATTRGVDLVAVRAWQPPPVPCRDDTPAPKYDVDSLADAELRLTDRVLRAWQDKYPGVTVRIQLTPGNAAEALIAATADAQLGVVGSHGRGGFAGQPLGSVAEQLIHHAQCPVAVVRDTAGLG